MPGMDGTGPRGFGSRTGGGLGPCGMGLGLGRGFGRGNWRRPVATAPVNLTKEEQKRILEAELEELEKENQAIKKRIEELK